MTDADKDWSIASWRQRHVDGYFPNSVEHAGWRVYDAMPDWFDGNADIRASDFALEIGCGYGQWMIPLSKRVAHVSGVDVHASPIAKASELFYAHSVHNASVGICSGDTVCYPDETFSFVYSISVFQHLPKKMVNSYLAETRRLLSNGGRCFHHFRNIDNVGPYPTPATDIVANHQGDFSCGWTASEVATSAACAGFSEFKVVDIGLFLLLTAAKQS